VRETRVLAAWLVAIAALLLLLASLRGEGTGPWGLTLLRHMVWWYALVGIAFVVALTFARPSPAAGADGGGAG
jgi:hypothetical protein